MTVRHWTPGQVQDIERRVQRLHRTLTDKLLPCQREPLVAMGEVAVIIQAATVQAEDLLRHIKSERRAMNEHDET